MKSSCRPGDKLVLSSSPHIKDSDSVRRIMYKVILALLPACIAGVYFFGWRAALVMLLTMAFCVGAEALWCFLAKKPVTGTISDGSAALTGLLLALNLPPQVPYWVCLIGAFLAIWLGKQVFGGIGNNPFNPALVARVGLLIALPAIMTTWQPARGMSPDSADAELWYSPATIQELKDGKPLDSVSCATPLGVVGTTKKITERSFEAESNFEAVSNNDLMFRYFLGQKGGCIGETSVLALLIGGIILVLFKLINWRVPVVYIGTVAVFAGIVHYFFPASRRRRCSIFSRRPDPRRRVHGDGYGHQSDHADRLHRLRLRLRRHHYRDPHLGQLSGGGQLLDSVHERAGAAHRPLLHGAAVRLRGETG